MGIYEEAALQNKPIVVNRDSTDCGLLRGLLLRLLGDLPYNRQNIA